MYVEFALVPTQYHQSPNVVCKIPALLWPSLKRHMKYASVEVDMDMDLRERLTGVMNWLNEQLVEAAKLAPYEGVWD